MNNDNNISTESPWVEVKSLSNNTEQREFQSNNSSFWFPSREDELSAKGSENNGTNDNLNSINMWKKTLTMKSQTSVDAIIRPINTASFAKDQASIRISGVNRMEIPQFISSQVTVFDKCTILKILLPCYFWCHTLGQNNINTVTGSDLENYYLFKHFAIQEYNPHNSEHEKSLKFLFLCTLDCDWTNDLISKYWLNMGFSSDNPRIDLKRGGYFSLLFITYFVNQFKEEFNIMKQKTFFLFAQSAVVLCFYMKLALDISIDEKECNDWREVNKIRKVSIFEFKNFAHEQSLNSNFIYDNWSDIWIKTKEQVVSGFITERNHHEQVLKNNFNYYFYEKLRKPGDSFSEQTSVDSTSTT